MDVPSGGPQLRGTPQSGTAPAEGGTPHPAPCLPHSLCLAGGGQPPQHCLLAPWHPCAPGRAAARTHGRCPLSQVVAPCQAATGGADRDIGVSRGSWCPRAEAQGTLNAAGITLLAVPGHREGGDGARSHPQFPMSPPKHVPHCFPSLPAAPALPPAFFDTFPRRDTALPPTTENRRGGGTPAPCQPHSRAAPSILSFPPGDDVAPGVFDPHARVPRPRHHNYSPRHRAKNTAGAAKQLGMGAHGGTRGHAGRKQPPAFGTRPRLAEDGRFPARRQRGQGRVTASVGSARGGGQHLLGRGGSG